MSSEVPANEKLPCASEVADLPVCGPSRSSTLAPLSGLSAVSDTVPAIDSPIAGAGVLGAVGGGVADTGERESPHPARPWTSIRTTIPVRVLFNVGSC